MLYLLLTVYEGEPFLEWQQGCVVPLVCVNSLPHDKPLDWLMGLAHHFTLGLWTGMFADRAVPVWWKNVSIRI